MTQQGKNIIGARVKQSRLSIKPSLTQDELSGRVAVHGVKLDRSAIAKIEGGIRLVTDYELLALAKALNVDVQWLLEGKR
jgi:transcriptional regulator with XRE-family HTH domain